MIDHNHFICHFIFGGHLLNIPSTFGVKRKGVLVETLRRFESNRINSVVDHKYKPCTSFGDNLYMRVFRKQLS